jgi:hypothetical protein
LNKAKLHHWLVVLKRVKTWQLVLIVLVMSLLSAFLLRQNNLSMVERRDALKTADQQNKDVKKALLGLQQYVTSHMNTDLGGGIFLQGAYQRAYDAAVKSAVVTTNPGSKIYEQVELECRPVFRSTGSFPAYTQCAREKLAGMTAGQDAIDSLKTPPVDLYHYNFVSPVWSLDAAGIIVFMTTVTLVVLLVRTISYFALYLLLRIRRKPTF